MKFVDSLIEKIIRGYYVATDVIAGVFFAVLSVVMFVNTFSIRQTKEPVSPVDTPSFFPQLVFGMLFICSVAMAVQGLGKMKANRAKAPEGEQLEKFVGYFKRGVAALVMIGVFIGLISPLGFIPAAILYMIGSMFFMGARESWKPVAYVLTAVLTAFLLFFLFKKYIYVTLPMGILKGVLG